MITWNPTRSIDIPVTRPITEKFLGKSGYSPLSLFAKGEQGVWYDPSDMTTLFQDNLGTVPVTAAGQVVGMMKDKSGRGNHATQSSVGSKPILRNSGALWWLEFDGVDDFLVTSSVDFTATDKMSVFAGVRKLSDAATGIVVELSYDTNANLGTFYLAAPVSAADPSYTFAAKATRVVGRQGTPYAAPITNVVSGQVALRVSQEIRVNGTTFSGSTPAHVAGNFGNYPLYIGRRAGTLFPFAGYLYGLIVRGALTDAAGITSTEKFMGTKSGVTL